MIKDTIRRATLFPYECCYDCNYRLTLAILAPIREPFTTEDKTKNCGETKCEYESRNNLESLSDKLLNCKILINKRGKLK